MDQERRFEMIRLFNVRKAPLEEQEISRSMLAAHAPRWLVRLHEYEFCALLDRAWDLQCMAEPKL